MLRFLNQYIKNNKIKFVLLITVNVLVWGISLSLPFFNGKLIDAIVSGHDRRMLVNMIIIITTLSLLNLLIGYFMSIAFQKMITNIVQSINHQVITHIRKLPIKFNYNINAGYLTQMIISDSNTVSNFTVTSSKDLPLGILGFLFNLFILININIKVGIVLLILLPIYIGLFFLFKKKMYTTNFLYKESESQYFEEVHSQIENIKFVKINALEKMFNRDFIYNFNNFFKNFTSFLTFSSLFSNLGSFITVLANIIILILGVIEIFEGNLTLGEFTIITTYFNMVIGNVDYFLNFFKNYQTTLVSYNRLNDILDMEQEKVGIAEAHDIVKIEFKNVSFSYTEYPLIKDFSFTFEKGKVYKIDGENGKGKSTILDLILGLHDDFRGSILLNEKDIRDFNIYKIRKNLISVVEQDLTIINGSVKKNVSLDKDIVMDQIEYLASKMNFENFTKEDDFNTILVRKSNNLSGGEKQKLNIIRNLLKNSKLLILDEPNSALDANSSEALKQIILTEKENRITILISHTDIFEEIIDEKISL